MPRVQRLLDRQVFDDGLDDDVAGGDRGRQVVLQVADGHQRVEAGREERGRLGLARPLQAGGGDLVARRAVAGGRVLGGDIQQAHAEAGVGQVGRDGRPHDARSQYRHFADRLGGHENTITARRVEVEAGRSRRRRSVLRCRGGTGGDRERAAPPPATSAVRRLREESRRRIERRRTPRARPRVHAGARCWRCCIFVALEMRGADATGSRTRDGGGAIAPQARRCSAFSIERRGGRRGGEVPIAERAEAALASDESGRSGRGPRCLGHRRATARAGSADRRSGTRGGPAIRAKAARRRTPSRPQAAREARRPTRDSTSRVEDLLNNCRRRFPTADLDPDRGYAV